ncbi:MAG: LPS export ABC transporter periplasmic protein LptC [Ignavibacteria bacterium GWF2_33_9]|nr:MAG: LPS export ABC transporter periplasmic protein LptC [Ignavibacteria bacterium GWF2_33_9]
MDDTAYQKALKEDAKITADQIANNISVVFFDSTWTKAILKADRAEIYTTEKRTEIIGNVKVEYFSKITGNRLSILTCQEATVDDQTKNMEARGNVVVFSDSALVKMETSKLYWDNVNALIHTNENIVITTRRETIRGKGFESNLDLSNYKIYKVSGIQQ